MKKLLVIALLAYLSFSPATTLAQCPMCKTAVESNRKDGNSTIGLGLNDGILYLLAAPYLMIAGVGAIWYIRKQKQQAHVR